MEQQEPVSNMSLMLLFGVKVLCNPVLKYFMQTNQRDILSLNKPGAEL